MNGKPLNAVIQGAIKIGQQFMNSHTFDKLLNIEFNHLWTNYKFKSMEQYQSRCEEMQAYGGTDFANVFNTILWKYQDKYYSKFKDLTIVFMTDGMTDSEQALNSLLNNCPCNVSYNISLILSKAHKNKLITYKIYYIIL